MTVQQMADEVAELIEMRLQIGGDGLAEKLRRGRRFLPRNVRRAADYLAQSAEAARIPRVQMRLDHDQIAAAHGICVGYLKPLGADARRRAYLMDVVKGLGLGIFVAGAVLLAALIWRGLV